MELVLKTSGQQCLVGSNPTASAKDAYLKLAVSYGVCATDGGILFLF